MTILFIKDFLPTSDHTSEINTLLNAKDSDKIKVAFINNQGGISKKGYELTKAIIESKAFVEVIVVGTSKSTAAHMWSILCLENLPNIECTFENEKSNLMFHRPSQKVDGELVGVEGLPEGADKESAIKLSDNIKTCLLNLLIKKPELSAFKSCGVILYKSEADIILDYDNGKDIILANGFTL